MLCIDIYTHMYTTRDFVPGSSDIVLFVSARVRPVIAGARAESSAQNARGTPFGRPTLAARDLYTRLVSNSAPTRSSRCCLTACHF